MKNSSPDKIEKVAAEIAADCLAMRVRFLNRSLTAIYDDAFRSLGITTGQVNMLVAIIKQESLTSRQLGDILNIEKSTLSRNLERMRKSAWIELTPPATGRAYSIKASRKGKALLRKVLPCWQNAQDDAVDLLGMKGARVLKSVGNQVRKKL